MNEIKIFENSEFGAVRTVTIDNVPYFVGKDVTTVLGYADTFGALKKHVDEEDKQNCQNDSFESPRGLTVINESGLYSLILGSQLPMAKKFKKWVTSEVLPAIRKQGGYLTNEKIEEVLNNPDTIIQLATNLKAEREKRKQAEEKSQTVKDEKEQKLFLQKQGGIPFQNGIHYYIRHTDNIHIHTHTQIFYR